MKKSDSIANLAKALTAFQSVVDGAKKSSSNPFYKSKYADLGEIWKTIREPLCANGLSIVQTGEMSDGELVHVETTLLHESGEYVSGTMSARVVQKLDKNTNTVYVDPQGVGSAITYARRYGLSAILGIHQEDDDANEASNVGKKAGKPIDGSQIATQPESVSDEPVISAKAKALQKDIAIIVKDLIGSTHDGWEVPTRKENSFKKHLGTKTLAECGDTEKLTTYLAYMQKYQSDALADTKVKAFDRIQSMSDNDAYEYRAAINDCSNMAEITGILASIDSEVAK